MIGWMFPGQPLRCEQFTNLDGDLGELHQLCSESTGYDLLTCQPCSGITLSAHTSLQIHGVVSSLYHGRRLRKAGQVPVFLAEHSLGIYSALAAAGAISEFDALQMVTRIGACMARMGTVEDYALGCPIGLQVGFVESAARNNGVFVANYNTSRHFLLAGNRAGVEAALAECQEAGAFSVSSFSCEAPLHTPLMAEISAELSAIVSDYQFSEPTLPLLEHINQTCLTATSIPGFLVHELQQPVYWEQSWLALRSIGCNRWLEVGCGSALTKFNRWIDTEFVV